MGIGSDVACTDGCVFAGGVFVIDTGQTSSRLSFGKVITLEIEPLDGVLAGLEPADAGEAPGFPSIAPKPSSATALARAIPKEKSVPDCVWCTPDGEIKEIFRFAYRTSRAPPDKQVFLLE